MVRREEKDDHVLRALARLKTTLYREFLALDHPYYPCLWVPYHLGLIGRYVKKSHALTTNNLSNSAAKRVPIRSPCHCGTPSPLQHLPPNIRVDTNR